MFEIFDLVVLLAYYNGCPGNWVELTELQGEILPDILHDVGHELFLGLILVHHEVSARSDQVLYPVVELKPFVREVVHEYHERE